MSENFTPKQTAAALRGFLATATALLSCFTFCSVPGRISLSLLLATVLIHHLTYINAELRRTSLILIGFVNSTYSIV